MYFATDVELALKAVAPGPSDRAGSVMSPVPPSALPDVARGSVLSTTEVVRRSAELSPLEKLLVDASEPRRGTSARDIAQDTP